MRLSTTKGQRTMNKYLTIVDHKAGSGLDWTFIENNSETTAQAKIKSAIDGFKQKEVYCVLLGKRVKKDRYVAICQIYADGSFKNLSGSTSIDSQWGCAPRPTFIAEADDIQKA